MDKQYVEGVYKIEKGFFIAQKPNVKRSRG